MARMRTIKPEYGTSEMIAELSVPCRLHFALMWTYADDAGRGIDNPKLLKAAIWPLDDDVPPSAVEQLQDELACHGRIVRYTNNGRRLFEIVGFGDHQKPNRPVPSKLPGADDTASVHTPPPTHCPHTECSVSAHAPLIPVVEGRVGECRGTSSSVSSALQSDGDPSTNLAAAVDIVAERRAKQAEARTKQKPAVWLAKARQGIAQEIRDSGADLAEPPTIIADAIEPLAPPPPAPRPECAACLGMGVIEDDVGFAHRCECMRQSA